MVNENNKETHELSSFEHGVKISLGNIEKYLARLCDIHNQSCNHQGFHGVPGTSFNTPFGVMGIPTPQQICQPNAMTNMPPRADGYSSVYQNAMPPTGHEHPYGAARGSQGKPQPRLLGRPIYFKSTLNIESPIDMATVPDSIRKAKEELVASGVVLYEMNIGAHNDAVSIVADLSKVTPCDSMVSELPESMEMLAHLMYIVLTGHSATLTIIHNEARPM